MEKPFKCTKCSQCFANSDHLAVHKCQLHVKIPSILYDQVSDQTPTPTRFMQTSDVVDSQLFEEINPFDQDFSLASKNQHRSDLNHDDNTSNNIKQSKGPLQTPIPIINPIPSFSSSSLHSFKKSLATKNIGEGEVIADQKCYSTSESSVSSTTESIKKEDNESFLIHQGYQELCQTEEDQTQTTEQRHNSAVFALYQQQLRAQSTPSVIVEPPGLSNSVSSSTQLNQQAASHEALREHLNKLIKSGQIKIQFSSSPSSTKVHATIVGTIATKQAGTQSVVFQNNVNPLVLSSLASTAVSPLSIGTIASSTLSLNNAAGSTLTKQKLRQTVQQNSINNMDNNNSLNGISHRISISPSNQGKYKDIILEDEDSMKEGSESGGKRRGRTSEDLTPDEKRRKFLERNRAAASRCRQKRKVWVNQLERKSDDLMQTNTELMNEISNLRSEVAQLKALLLAHKECPVTLQQQQKSLLGRISSGVAYVTVSDGQIIAIHPMNNNELNDDEQVNSAEELATSALTDMGSINQP